MQRKPWMQSWIDFYWGVVRDEKQTHQQNSNNCRNSELIEITFLHLAIFFKNFFFSKLFPKTFSFFNLIIFTVFSHLACITGYFLLNECLFQIKSWYYTLARFRVKREEFVFPKASRSYVYWSGDPNGSWTSKKGGRVLLRLKVFASLCFCSCRGICSRLLKKNLRCGFRGSRSQQQI